MEAKPLCVDWLPYGSVAEFKLKNPDCCAVLRSVPGDQAMTYRPNIRGEKHPRMYLVRMAFTAFARSRGSNAGTPVAYQHEIIATIDCYGNRMRDDVP
jgi:hypothetical protein